MVQPTFWNKFYGPNHNKALVLFGAWTFGVCGYLARGNYHPSRPAPVAQDNGEFDIEKILREAQEAEAVKK